MPGGVRETVVELSRRHANRVSTTSSGNRVVVSLRKQDDTTRVMHSLVGFRSRWDFAMQKRTSVAFRRQPQRHN